MTDMKKTETKGRKKPANAKKAQTQISVSQNGSPVQYAVMKDGARAKVLRMDGKYVYFADTRMRILNPNILRIEQMRGE